MIFTSQSIISHAHVWSLLLGDFFSSILFYHYSTWKYCASYVIQTSTLIQAENPNQKHSCHLVFFQKPFFLHRQDLNLIIKVLGHHMEQRSLCHNGKKKKMLVNIFKS